MTTFNCTMCLNLVLVLSLSIVALGNNNVQDNNQFQAFYLIQQWLASYCNQEGVPCCYPETGKPEGDFTVYGLWPYFSDGTFPKLCDGASFDVAPLKAIQDSLQKAWPSFTCPLIGRKFWLHEWNKRGTCSKSVLDEMSYFQAAIDLKNKINLLQILEDAGIKPNNQFYSLDSIKQAISRATGLNPWIQCNGNAQGNRQLWQIILCADSSGKKFVQCPAIPKGLNGCASDIQFVTY